MGSYFLSVFLLALVFTGSHAGESSPLWKVFCQPTPIYRGRADPIIAPGGYSQHSHKVFGGSAFGLYKPSDSPMDVYNSQVKSKCTTASLSIDNSNYWIPDLYYRWPDGSLELVPNGGLTAYYEARTGTGDQKYPKWQAFPKGFRMIAGDPFRRSFNKSSVSQSGMSYACLSASGGPETPYFPTDKQFCLNGLRTQVYFPMCWDGKNLDSASHESHVAYPIEMYNNGNCPNTHPVRLPGLFYEVLYSVDKFPHGQGTQPFVWACGDPTGYGLHGDFLNGWDTVQMQKALEDLSCYANSTNNGNDVAACKPFAPYLKTDNKDMSCVIETPVNNFEDLGVNHKISHLPGCNPIATGPGEVNPCTGSWPQKIMTPNLFRIMIKSKVNNKYVSARTPDSYLTADSTSDAVYYPHVFELLMTGANTYTIQSEMTMNFVSANNKENSPITANRPSPSTWETWNFQFQGGAAPSLNGTLASILSYSNNMYVVTNAQGQLIPNSKTPELFLIIDANAGVADTRTVKF